MKRLISYVYDYIYHFVVLAPQRLTDTEWQENWRSWPHCNGQARCWMHTSAIWCDCICRWCKIARRVR